METFPTISLTSDIKPVVHLCWFHTGQDGVYDLSNRSPTKDDLESVSLLFCRPSLFLEELESSHLTKLGTDKQSNNGSSWTFSNCSFLHNWRLDSMVLSVKDDKVEVRPCLFSVCCWFFCSLNSYQCCSFSKQFLICNWRATFG